MRKHLVIFSVLIAYCSPINNDTINNQLDDSINSQTEGNIDNQTEDSINNQADNDSNSQTENNTNNQDESTIDSQPNHIIDKQPVNYITAKDVVSECQLPYEEFRELYPQWQVSEYVLPKNSIHYDFNNDNEEDLIALLRVDVWKTDYQDGYCNVYYEDKFSVLVDLSNGKTVLTDFGIEYAIIPKLTKTENGFTVDYWIGQGRKCFFTASFTVDNNNTYLSNAVTECDENNTASNKMTYPQTSEYLIENINLPDIFSEVRAQSHE